MIYVDLKYISQISPQLRNFKKKKDFLFNCSCPICGDSTKKTAKARGYFYQKNTSMFYKCHNCGAGLSVSNFLKLNFPTFYNSYIFEKYKNDDCTSISSNTRVKDVFTKASRDVSSSNWIKISELPDTHYIKSYASTRKIPLKYFDKLFFTENFDLLVKDLCPNSNYSLVKGEHRLIIPFYSKNNTLIGFQGRSLSSDKKLRYITVKIDSDTKLIYGLNSFDENKPGYVVEGPIDSMFIENCLAAANSDLESINSILKANLTLIYDNEPRNLEIIKLMSSAINHGNNICIWPQSIIEKDINEMIMSGHSISEINHLIRSRTFSGLKAQLEFNLWKKI